MKKIAFFVIISISLFQLSAFARGEDDLKVFNLELEKVLNLGSGILALILFIITLVAYKTTKTKKLIYVSTAFALFALKGFMISMELFFGDWPWVDPVASLLDFGILLTFFTGILKK